MRGAHWYSLDREGIATLCIDENDARKTAGDSDVMWPRRGPHRAVQMVEVGAALAARDAAGPALTWQDIAIAPIGEAMFVARAIDVKPHAGYPATYTTDPYCVWQPEPGVFKRWPHAFPPTHYCLLAPLPMAAGSTQVKD